MTESHLANELRTFEAHRQRLIAESEGKWAVAHGDAIIGVWDTYEDALTAGYNTCGLEPFLVKRIEGADHLQFISRDFEVCR